MKNLADKCKRKKNVPHYFTKCFLLCSIVVPCSYAMLFNSVNWFSIFSLFTRDNPGCSDFRFLLIVWPVIVIDYCFSTGSSTFFFLLPSLRRASRIYLHATACIYLSTSSVSMDHALFLFIPSIANALPPLTKWATFMYDQRNMWCPLKVYSNTVLTEIFLLYTLFLFRAKTKTDKLCYSHTVGYHTAVKKKYSFHTQDH